MEPAPGAIRDMWRGGGRGLHRPPADRRDPAPSALTTPRGSDRGGQTAARREFPPFAGMSDWSGRWESNPRHTAWEAVVLPLNYARNLAQASGAVRDMQRDWQHDHTRCVTAEVQVAPVGDGREKRPGLLLHRQ